MKVFAVLCLCFAASQGFYIAAPAAQLAQDLAYQSVDADMDGQPDKVAYVQPYAYPFAHPFAYSHPVAVAAAPVKLAADAPAQLAQDFEYHSVDANMDGYPDSKQLFPVPVAYAAHPFGFPFAPVVVKAAEKKD